MPIESLDPDALAETVAAFEAAGGNISQAARSLGIARQTMQHRMKRAARCGLLPACLPAPARPAEGYEIANRSVRLDKAGGVIGQTVTHRAARGDDYALPAGHTVKGESAFVGSDNRVIAKWIKTRENRRDDWLPALRDSLAAFNGYIPRIAAPRLRRADLLTVYVIPDAHIGMHAWWRETGASYDLKIARRVITDSVGALIAQSQASEHAIVLWLGDTTHQNDSRNATPRSGHVLDVDGRWPKVQATALDIALCVITAAAARHRRVMTRFIPGNHDQDAAHALTLAAGKSLEHTKRIVVDDDPGLHFFHRFGATLIGATHGHTMPFERMAALLANERPADWGETKFGHVFFGHVHRESSRELGRVRVESFSSPAARDAYAAGGGFAAGRSLVAITYHRDRGEIGRHRVNIVPSSAAP